jgi:hypothetical protein
MRLTKAARLAIWNVLALWLCAASAVMLVGGLSGTDAQPPQLSANSNTLAADPQVEQALKRACYDCHSNEKPTSWNAHLAPSYLFGVDKARAALNFSDWSSYSAQRKRAELETIRKVVEDGSMPPGDYVFFHPGAKLSGDEKRALLQWTASQTTMIH